LIEKKKEKKREEIFRKNSFGKKNAKINQNKKKNKKKWVDRAVKYSGSVTTIQISPSI